MIRARRVLRGDRSGGPNPPAPAVDSQFINTIAGPAHMFSGRDLDSHFPYLAGYMRMLEIFADRLNTRPAADLSVADIIALMKARRPPYD